MPLFINLSYHRILGSASPDEHARSETFRWIHLFSSHSILMIQGEDGIGNDGDTYQYIRTSFAFWNDKNKILKEILLDVNGHQDIPLKSFQPDIA